jgi:hypothetical protein
MLRNGRDANLGNVLQAKFYEQSFTSKVLQAKHQKFEQ